MTTEMSNSRQKYVLVFCFATMTAATTFGVVKYLDARKPKLDTRRSKEEQRRDFDPDRVLAEQPAITKLSIVSAKNVGDTVEDDELVLGVVIDGKARAYSINSLTSPAREVFNDTLAGRPIAATW